MSPPRSRVPQRPADGFPPRVRRRRPLARRARSVALLLPLALAPAVAAAQPPSVADSVPLLEGLGDHHMPVTTRVPLAQRYFDQGLRLAYAFNHEAARRAFAHAAQLDPDCAMCHWGVAYTLGTNINLPMAPEAEAPAREAARRARAAAGAATARERGYVAAIVARHAAALPDDAPRPSRAALDSAYARAMRELAARVPDDPDALTLAAEAAMNLRPWQYWTRTGEPEPGTAELLAALERAMALQPSHPGACHFYIHAVEAYHAERAVACAERLASAMPAAGHLVHMPGHIYIRVGRWEEAIEANEHAVHADESYIADQGASGFYPLAYYPHNYHFLAFAATMLGDEARAVPAARAAAAKIPPDVAAQVMELQFLTPFPHLVLAAFDRWDAVLAEPVPPPAQLVGHALAVYARGLAQAARGDGTAARASLATVRAAGTRVEAQPFTGALAIAARMLEAELDWRAGRRDAAIAALQAAAALEDELGYMEPPYWMPPVRATLGERLLAHGRPADAIAAFEADLRRFPKNRRSTDGLARARQRRAAAGGR